MRVLPKSFAFGGLNTRSVTTGLPVMDQTVLQDMRVVGTDLVQRKGIVRVGKVSGNAKAMDFDGTNQHASAAVDTRPWTLGLYWTLEVVIEPDVTSGTQGILCVGDTTPAMILDITGGNIRFRIWDSGATLDTITVGAATTSTQTVQITRSAATLSTKLDNGTAVTGTMSATLNVRTPAGDFRIARDDGANYFDGTVDGVRLLSVVRSDHKDRLVRLPNPRSAYVLADYDFNESAGGLIYDRSRFEGHLITQNSPTETTSLSHNPAPIRALSMAVDEATKKKQLLVCAGGSYYLADAG